ncbi:MAG: enoyl-CoA hydratase-related protein [Burkholderiales bacterium]
MSGLIVTRDGAVVRLTLNRPEALNALDIETARALLAACVDIRRDPSVRAVLLAGNGRAFCAGGDLAQMRSDPARVADALIAAMHEALTILAQLDAPVVVALHGAVSGAGASLAAAADLAIAAEGTKFNLAYINIGTSSDLGSTWALPRLVGLRRALEIALLADTFDAAHALHIGFVNRVVPADRLGAEAEALAQRLARGPTLALGRIRRLMRTSFERDLSGQLDAEHVAFLQSAATPDFAEGVAAFFDRRPPRFTGQP